MSKEVHVLFNQRLMGYEDVDPKALDLYHTKTEGYILCLRDLGLLTDKEYFDCLTQSDGEYQKRRP